MTILDTQRDLVYQKIMKQELQKGSYPSISLIEELINDSFKKKGAGLPRFTFREMKKGEASSSSDYNSLFEEMNDDLYISFEEVKRLNNRIMSLTNYYEASQIQINRLLDELQLKTDNLQMKIESDANKEVIGDTLSNFTHIDFKGNNTRNIPITNAFVNLRHSNAEIERQKDGTRKIDLSESKIEFHTENHYEKINLTPFQAALGDHLHESWRTIVVTNDPISVLSTLSIELNEPEYISNVTIDIQAGKPVYTSLLISEDGEEFIELERRKIISTYQWVFKSRPIKKIRFKMEKREHDRSNGSQYEYLFGAKHIELMNQEYKPDSYFVSKPLQIQDHEAVKQISLDIDDYVPADTTIKYYVGFDYNNNVIEWQEIRKDRPVVTDMVKPYNVEIHHYTEGYGDMMMERFGRSFYRIAQLPHKPLKKSIRLNIGRNMWLKEIIPAPFIYERTDHESDEVVYQTGIYDWVRNISPRKNYIRIQNGFDYLQANKFHRYSTWFFVRDPVTFQSTVRGTVDTSHAVFLNGGQVKGISNSYTLSLQEGWNRIEIYAYARVINEELILDFYNPDMTTEIFAGRNPLEQVSLYDLLNNTSSRMHDRFAVDNENNIIVNYDPRRMDVQSHFKTTGSGLEKKGVSMAGGVEYTLQYDYSVSDQNEHALRFMAILSKEKEEVQITPRIGSYRLIVE